jgi:outer membrane protein assembly factor BamB
MSSAIAIATVLAPDHFVTASRGPGGTVAIPITRPVSSSTVVAGGIVYAAAPSPSDLGYVLGTTVYALRISTGARLWSRFILGGQGGLAVSGGAIYQTWTVGSSGGLYALRTGSGAMLWKRTFAGVSVPSDPAAGARLVYAAFYQSPIKSHPPAACAFRRSNGSLAWCQKLSGSGVSFQPLVDGRRLYVGADDRTEAFDASTGHHLWSRPVGTTSAPAVDPGKAVVIAGTYKSASQVVGLNPATGAVLWSRRIAGLYHSPVVVSGGKVYVAAFDGTIYAFDAASGSETWSLSTHDSFVPSLLVSQGVVYAGGPVNVGQIHTDTVRALRASSGRQLWQWRAPGMGVVEPLAVSDGVVAVSQNDPNQLVGLSSSHGRLRWVYPTDRGVEAAPLVSGSMVYAGSDDTRIYALHSAGGAVAWASATGGPVAYTPALLDHRVFAVTGYPDNSLHALNASNGKPLWSHAFQGDPIDAQPIAADSSVVVATTSHVYAFNPATGAVRWTHSHPPAAEVYDMLAASRGLVFAVSTADAHAHVVALNAANGHERWSFSTLGGEGPMAIAGGVLYIPGRSSIFALHIRSGKLLWRHITIDPAFFSVAVGNHTVYAGAVNPGNVYALSAATGKRRWVHGLQGAVRTLTVSGGTVYAGADHAYALNAVTGRVRWTSGISDGAALTVSGGRIYAGARGPRYGGIYRLTATNGHPMWLVPTARSPLAHG